MDALDQQLLVIVDVFNMLHDASEIMYLWTVHIVFHDHEETHECNIYFMRVAIVSWGLIRWLIKLISVLLQEESDDFEVIFR